MGVRVRVGFRARVTPVTEVLSQNTLTHCVHHLKGRVQKGTREEVGLRIRDYG